MSLLPSMSPVPYRKHTERESSPDRMSGDKAGRWAMSRQLARAASSVLVLVVGFGSENRVMLLLRSR